MASKNNGFAIPRPKTQVLADRCKDQRDIAYAMNLGYLAALEGAPQHHPYTQEPGDAYADAWRRGYAQGAKAKQAGS